MSDHCDILWVIRPNCYLDLGNGSKNFRNHWPNVKVPTAISINAASNVTKRHSTELIKLSY